MWVHICEYVAAMYSMKKSDKLLHVLEISMHHGRSLLGFIIYQYIGEYNIYIITYHQLIANYVQQSIYLMTWTDFLPGIID